MRLKVNGEERELKEGTTLQQVVESFGLNPGRIACEVNLRIVKRADYGKTVLKDGDAVEIVQMIGGG